MVLASEPTHTTVASELLVYFVFPVLVALVIALMGFGVWVVRNIGLLSSGLAVVVRDVNPPDAPSLRELVTELRINQGRIAERVGVGEQPAPGYGGRSDPHYRERPT